MKCNFIKKWHDDLKDHARILEIHSYELHDQSPLIIANKTAELSGTILSIALPRVGILSVSLRFHTAFHANSGVMRHQCLLK
ncbi:MAG: hypothetical protein P1V20_32365 [Verrucomicrobiales bacterium]|nr:hypothetical protein [Verrucomicrobiales bacterium]